MKRVAVVVCTAMALAACSGATSQRSGGAPDPTPDTEPVVTATTTTTTTRPRSSSALQGRTVVIDPGHNGANAQFPAEINRQVDAGGFRKACNTTGTAADGYKESTFNWEVSQRLRTLLQDRGATVVLTRDSDDGWGPCVDERGRTAQRVGADLLISVHADGASSSGRGFHVIAPSVVSGYTDDTAAPSKELAVAMRDALVGQGFSPSDYTGTDGLVTRRDLGTLNRAGVPAVIVESGNMKSPSDLARLRSDEGQQALAEALAQGAAAFLGR